MKAYSWQDLRLGLRESFEVEVTLAMVDLFGTLSGDDNPLHQDAAYARGAGFADRVVYGMLTASFYSRLVGVHLPGERALLQGIDIHFLKPVYIGERLTVRGEVQHLNEAYRQAQLVAEIVDDQEQLRSKAKIRVGIRD